MLIFPFTDKSLIAVAGSTSPSLLVDVEKTGEYSVDVSDANGCKVNSARQLIGLSESKYAFIYPNPSNGNFQVRYYNGTITSLKRMITIYDSKRTRVYNEAFTSGNGYDLMNVVMYGKASGIYLLDLRDEKGNRLASAKILVK